VRIGTVGALDGVDDVIVERTPFNAFFAVDDVAAATVTNPWIAGSAAPIAADLTRLCTFFNFCTNQENKKRHNEQT
jgi:hypothetical protein